MSFGRFLMEKIEEYLKEIEPDIKGKSRTYRIWGLDLEDVAQELRIHLMNKFDLFDPKKASFRTWANRVMRNKLTNMARDVKWEENITNASDLLDEEGESYYENLGEEDEILKNFGTNEAVLDAIQELPERQKDVVSLRVYEQYTFKEIAKELGISKRMAMKHWHRAKDKLGQRLSDFVI